MMSLSIQATWLRGNIRSKLSGISKAKFKFIELTENDLIDAYKNKYISGFALDVFENEPVNETFYKNILNDMNCILTPHIAGVTEESNVRVSNFIIDKINKFFENFKD